MSETAKQRKEREEREAAEAAAAAKEPSTDPAGKDTSTAGQASVAAPANQNAVSFGRTEELAAAEAIVRGGVTPAVAFPEAAPREQQEENLAASALEVARRMTGTEDGVSSVLPAVGGVTNLAMTQAERLAVLDDGAVDGRGRLAGTYYDDLEREEADRRRARIEGQAASPESAAAAERVRALASSPATSAADLGRPADEQARVNPRKLTGASDEDPNSPQRRQRESVDAERNAPAGARA